MLKQLDDNTQTAAPLAWCRMDKRLVSGFAFTVASFGQWRTGFWLKDDVPRWQWDNVLRASVEPVELQELGATSYAVTAYRDLTGEWHDLRPMDQGETS